VTKKYRPYLSLPMMERISELVAPYASNLDSEIYDTMRVMLIKAREEITKPSYVPLSSRLGMNVPINEQTGPAYRYNAGLMSPEEKAIYEETIMNEILKGSVENP
jgi:hypothetical protein